MTMLSPLARQVIGGLDPSTGRVRVPFGLCLHTTGRGVVAKAALKGWTALEVAIKTYLQSQDGTLHGYKWGGPAYVMDHDGSLHQIAPDNILTAHCGGPDRDDYLSGEWVDRTRPAAFSAWRKAWPGYPTPQHLYPSRTANADYIGCEMIPIGSGLGGAPRAPGMLFTQAQHDAAIALGRDLAARHGWPADWATTPRLVGHEDVQLLERQDNGGGWDPGARRAAPYWDDAYVRGALSKGS